MRLHENISLPKDWRLAPLKRLTRFGYGDALAADDRDPNGSIKVYGSNGPFDQHSAANTLGPCIIVGRKGSYGKCQYSEDPVFAVDTTFVVDRRHTEADLRYLFHLLGSLGLDELSDDTAVPGLSREKAYQSFIPIPPLETQKRIAAFLDEKTTRIDGLIEKKRALLDRLAEKRQAIITQAVTKGLNPAAPMKDSGIDWLGEIPAHWEVKRLRWYISVRSGEALRNEDMSVDLTETNTIPAIGGNGLMGYTNRSNSNGVGIIIGRVGALCGNVHPVNVNSWITDNALAVSRIQSFNLGYLIIQLRVRDLNNLAIRNAQPLMTGEIVKAQQLAHPPSDEQEAIVGHVYKESKNLDQMGLKISESLARLHEYRSALITAAVTGQIEGLR